MSFPANLQLSGGFKPLHNESLINAPVDPGMTVTYQWLVTESNGPAANDLSSVAYSYGSNADPTGNLYAGLFGAVTISREVRLLQLFLCS